MFNKNMGNMLKKAQDMQKRIQDIQSELADTIIDANSGGGLVTVKINGKLEILELNIDNDVLKEEKEVLEDLVISAMNKAISDAQTESQNKMNSVTGGMLSGLNIPGM